MARKRVDKHPHLKPSENGVLCNGCGVLTIPPMPMPMHEWSAWLDDIERTHAPCLAKMRADGAAPK